MLFEIADEALKIQEEEQETETSSEDTKKGLD